jgi:two-component system LytT family response regulator/two-component system response regulator AlgR
MGLRIVLADDEPLARRRLAGLLEEAGCTVLASLPDSAAVLDWFRAGEEADALFLDIQMPGLTGIELLAELEDPPPVVFVTAYVQFALQAFEAAAVDYLVKPVDPGRLRRTLERIEGGRIPRRRGSELAALVPAPGPRFPVRAGEGFVFLDLRKVTHFEVEEEIVYAWAGERFRTAWTTLGEVEAAFPGEPLLRIHRHLLLRPGTVVAFRPLLAGLAEVRVTGGQALRVSRNSVPRLKASLGLAGGRE